MRSVRRLIRASRFQVDEVRRQIADLTAMADDFKQQIAEHDQRVEDETRLCERMIEARSMFPAFLDKMRTERGQLIKKMDECLLLIHQLQNVLFEKFTHLKRLENYEDKLQQHLRSEAALLEQQDIDEVATNLFRKKNIFD